MGAAAPAGVFVLKDFLCTSGSGRHEQYSIWQAQADLVGLETKAEAIIPFAHIIFFFFLKMLSLGGLTAPSRPLSRACPLVAGWHGSARLGTGERQQEQKAQAVPSGNAFA